MNSVGFINKISCNEKLEATFSKRVPQDPTDKFSLRGISDYKTNFGFILEN